MMILTTRVVDGKIVLPEEARIADGTSVTVLAAEGPRTFELGPAEEQALLEAIAEADAGRFIDGDELLARL